MKQIIVFLIVGMLFLFSACRSIYRRPCSVKVEESALRFLVDTLFSKAYKDSVEVIIRPRVYGLGKASFVSYIGVNPTDTFWTADHWLRLKKEAFIPFQCHKKKEYNPFGGVKLKSPKGYRRMEWGVYHRMDKKGKKTNYIQITHFALYFEHHYYVALHCSNGVYVLVLDENLSCKVIISMLP